VKKDEKAFTVRLDVETYSKLRYIAGAEERSLSAQVARFLRKSVREFEAENGAIPALLEESNS